MSYRYKMLFAVVAILNSCSVYAAQVQQKSQKQMQEMYATAQKLGYFNLWQEKKLPQIKEFLTKHGAEIINFKHPESGITLLKHATYEAWSFEGFKEVLSLEGGAPITSKALLLQAIAQTMASEAQRAYSCYQKIVDVENNKVATFESHLRQIIADAQKSLAEISGNAHTNAAPKGESADDFVMID